ncbi:multiple ankyrin repeats single kh domain-containing protein [Fusarium bulbicola]|nr:multiple ankyrin repeats single kh domain-containing protein [Fusarium bulbicola]
MLHLPNELLAIIVSLSFTHTLASLSRCNKDYHRRFSPFLYQRDLAGPGLALWRSVSSYDDSEAVLNVFESILKAGGDLGKEINHPRSRYGYSMLPKGWRDGWSGINAVHLAAYAGHTEVVKFCMERGYVKSGSFRTGLLRCALRGRRIETSKFLIEHGADLGDSSALEFAAHHHVDTSIEELKFLIEQGEDLGDSTALEVAARHGMAEIVRLLLDEKGVDPNGWNGVSSPLFCAVQYSKVGSRDDALATVTTLLDRGANPDQPGYRYNELKMETVQMSPLAQACRLKECAIGLRLLERGAHPGCRKIPDREAALNRLRRCFLPDESKLIQFTTKLVDSLTDTTMTQRRITKSSTEPLDELLSFYMPRRGGRPSFLENTFFAPSLECLFVAHVLIRAGFQTPWAIRRQLELMELTSSWTRRNIELRMIYYPFFPVYHVYHPFNKINRIVWIAENERKGAHLFGRDDSPVFETEPNIGFRYDLKEIMKQWRSFVDIEFDKYVTVKLAGAC